MNVEEHSGITSDADLAAGTSVFSIERAKRIVETFARVTTSQDADAFVSGFTENCVVHYPPDAVLRGRQALHERMSRFFSSGKKDFTCNKRLRSISGNVLGVVWINEWTDAGTGKRMNSKGVEFWTMSGERIARWDAATAVWEAGSS